MFIKKNLNSNYILLLFFFLIIYLVPLNSRLLWQPDEVRYAEISREMIEKNNWTTPYLLNIRYFEKPVAGYWINNISQIIFGTSNFAVRIGAVFSTFITSITIYCIAHLMWHNKYISLSASCIYISMLLVCSIGTYNVLDPILTMWLTICMLFSYLSLHTTNILLKIISWVCIGLSSGMGFLTKGFLAFIIPAIHILTIIIYQKRYIELFKFGYIAICSAILITLPWVINIHKNEPDYWNYFFWIEHIKRFFDNNAQHKSPIWFYIPVIIVGSIPWFGILFGTILNILKKKIMTINIVFLISWFIISFIFFSVAKGKLITYMLPAMAPLSLLMSNYIFSCIKNTDLFFFKFNNLFNGSVGIIGILIFSILFYFKNPFYSNKENIKIFFGILFFIIWTIIALISNRINYKYWLCNSCYSLLLSLMVNYLIPQSTIDYKLPQNFIQKNLNILKNSNYIIADNVGWATAIAWELKKSNIYLYNDPGELKYGLQYSNNLSRIIHKNDIIQWIKNKNRHERIAVILSLNNKNYFFYKQLLPNTIIRNSRVILLIYN
uniref:Lipid IV(A) 4-amino-4-deoxy-L-arabinosyltransferase n=1 Tax=Candidatus Aschnera chinzeii TaxID=1485666 RepID=A0AAT9G4Z4_9ENTR|nr:MAG: lipid IV(A) 4-amino-4-deoxy-L-arabinosyltransferase [Candidatus Aschnera chinzeii]